MQFTNLHPYYLPLLVKHRGSHVIVIRAVILDQVPASPHERLNFYVLKDDGSRGEWFTFQNHEHARIVLHTWTQLGEHLPALTLQLDALNWVPDPKYPGLRILRGLTDESIARVGDRLTTDNLHLTCSYLTEKSEEHLSEFVHLHSISFSSCHLTREVIRAIASLPKLDYLSFQFTELPAETLLELGRCCSLRTLIINRTGKAKLVGFDQLPPVERLRLMQLTLDEADIRGIAKCETLRELYLYLSPKTLHEDWLLPLREMRLEVLDLSNVPLSDAVAETLCQIETLSILRLSDTELTDAGARRLLELPRLKKLFLSSNGFSDDFQQYVAQLKHPEVTIAHAAPRWCL